MAMQEDLALVPQTGQTMSYGDRDDGALQEGVASPIPRFTDNHDGTVTDNLTELVWLRDASCGGTRNFDEALAFANNLASGDCGLSDGSNPGDWRQPNLREQQSLIDYGQAKPALPEGHPFTNVQQDNYWSSSTYADNTVYGWDLHLSDGFVSRGDKADAYYVWPVRGGQ